MAAREVTATTLAEVRQALDLFELTKPDKCPVPE